MIQNCINRPHQWRHFTGLRKLIWTFNFSPKTDPSETWTFPLHQIQAQDKIEAKEAWTSVSIRKQKLFWHKRKKHQLLKKWVSQGKLGRLTCSSISIESLSTPFTCLTCSLSYWGISSFDPISGDMLEEIEIASETWNKHLCAFLSKKYCSVTITVTLLKIIFLKATEKVSAVDFLFLLTWRYCLRPLQTTITRNKCAHIMPANLPMKEVTHISSEIFAMGDHYTVSILKTSYNLCM